MTRTHEEVGYLPEGVHTRETAAEGVERALKLLDGRWKLIILFHLFGGNIIRFSALERANPAVSQIGGRRYVPYWTLCYHGLQSVDKWQEQPHRPINSNTPLSNGVQNDREMINMAHH